MIWGLAGLSFLGGPTRSVVAPPTAKGCSSVCRGVFPSFSAVATASPLTYNSVASNYCIISARCSSIEAVPHFTAAQWTSESCLFFLPFFCSFYGTGLIFLFPKLWEKSSSNDWEKLLKFEAEGQKISKVLRWLGLFIWTVIGQYPF